MKRPDPLTILAFVLFVLIGGSNFVAVRFSNRELPPFFGAGVRFFAASVMLIVIALVFRPPRPRGHELVGPLVFGLLNFAAAYAFFYWGAQEVPAALGAVIFAAVPLMTLVLAVTQRIEPFRLRALLGGLIAGVGVVVIVGAPVNASVPFVYIGTVVISAVGAAQAAIVIKRFPPVHPVFMNAIAMGVGGCTLLLFSALSGEEWQVPTKPATWYALAFMVPIGSVVLFVLYVFVVQRWTASAASFQFVLFPVVAAIAGALVADEPLDASVGIGGVIVLVGIYVGALARSRKPVRIESAV